MKLQKGKWGTYTVKENKSLFFFPNEWVKIIKLAKPRQQLSFNMQIHTGARITEALNIKVIDIDFERNNLNLRVTKVRAKKKETKPTPRMISISSQFAKQLRKYIKKYNLKQDDYFPMIKRAATTSAIKYLARKIGRKDWRDFSSHNLRKTFECWLIAIGIDGFKVAKHMGHTPAVALNSYISPDIFTYEDKKLIRNILGDLYSYNERRFQ